MASWENQRSSSQWQDTALNYTGNSEICCFCSDTVTGNSMEHTSLNHPRPTNKVTCPDLQRIHKCLILIHQVLTFWQFLFCFFDNYQKKKNASKNIICIPQLQLPLHQLHRWGQVDRISFITWYKTHTPATGLRSGNKEMRVRLPFRISWKWHTDISVLSTWRSEIC